MTLIHFTPRARSFNTGKVGSVYHEPTPRRHRAWVKAQVNPARDPPVLDGRDVSIIWEDGGIKPHLAFPKSVVPLNAPRAGYIFREAKVPRSELDKGPARQGNLASKFYDLVDAESGAVVGPYAAWTWDTSITSDISNPTAYDPSGVGKGRSIGDLIGINEHAFGTWYEELEKSIPGGYVKDPYHRVDAYYTDRHVQIYTLDGSNTLLAESKRPLIVFETGMPNRYYLERKDVINADGILSKELTGLTTVCPYKGAAEYHDVILPSGKKLENQVWTYKAPVEDAPRLKGLLAFWVPGPNFKLVVDGEEVKA